MAAKHAAICVGGVLLLFGLTAASLALGHQRKAMSSTQIDSLWDIDDPVAGYAALTKALDKYPGSADEIHTQIARSLGLQNKFDEGWAELAKISDRPNTIVQVRLQLESGRLKNSSGDRAGSKSYFLRALDMAERGHFDYYAVDAAHMLGIATDGQESLDWNQKAIAMAGKSEDVRTQDWKGSLLNNLGWTYHDMGRFLDALKEFEEAVKFQKEYGESKRVRIAHWAVARCLRSLGRYREALRILNELVKYPEVGYVSEELGEDLLAIGRTAEARRHFRRAYKLLSQDQDLKSREPKRLKRLRLLGGA